MTTVTAVPRMLAAAAGASLSSMTSSRASVDFADMVGIFLGWQPLATGTVVAFRSVAVVITVRILQSSSVHGGVVRSAQFMTAGVLVVVVAMCTAGDPLDGCEPISRSRGVRR